MLKNILIQGIGIFGTVLYFASFQCKKNQNLFRVQLLSYLCYTLHLLLLGALTGGASYIINMGRSFCLGSGKERLKGKEMCLILCGLQLLVLLLTWKGWSSLLPVAANIAATVGGYTHNARKIRLVSLFVNSPLWIIYDLLVGSWAGILDEVFSDVSMILSILRFGWKNLDRTE